MGDSLTKTSYIDHVKQLDSKLSQRFISLDPYGYFLIRIDSIKYEIIVEHYSNDIDQDGQAIDPITGEAIKCNSNEKRRPTKTFCGKTAKEVGIELTENNFSKIISRYDHALYLGRELQKAENCLKNQSKYSQD